MMCNITTNLAYRARIDKYFYRRCHLCVQLCDHTFLVNLDLIYIYIYIYIFVLFSSIAIIPPLHTNCLYYQRKMKMKQLESLLEVEGLEEESELVMRFPRPYGTFGASVPRKASGSRKYSATKRKNP